MQNSKRLLMIVGIFIVTLLGCREEHRYEYRPVELKLFEGDFLVNTEGEYGRNYEKDGKKMLDYSYPYYIQFTYAVTPDKTLNKMMVKGITLLGKKTGKVHVLADIEANDFRVYAKRAFFRTSAGPLTADEYQYQDYMLKATIVIYRTETDFEEQDIEVLLKTEYRKERRSDWFDEKMSV